MCETCSAVAAPKTQEQPEVGKIYLSFCLLIDLEYKFEV